MFEVALMIDSIGALRADVRRSIPNMPRLGMVTFLFWCFTQPGIHAVVLLRLQTSTTRSRFRRIGMADVHSEHACDGRRVRPWMLNRRRVTRSAPDGDRREQSRDDRDRLQDAAACHDWREPLARPALR